MAWSRFRRLFIRFRSSSGMLDVCTAVKSVTFGSSNPRAYAPLAPRFRVAATRGRPFSLPSAPLPSPPLSFSLCLSFSLSLPLPVFLVSAAQQHRRKKKNRAHLSAILAGVDSVALALPSRAEITARAPLPGSGRRFPNPPSHPVKLGSAKPAIATSLPTSRPMHWSARVVVLAALLVRERDMVLIIARHGCCENRAAPSPPPTSRDAQGFFSLPLSTPTLGSVFGDWEGKETLSLALKVTHAEEQHGGLRTYVGVDPRNPNCKILDPRRQITDRSPDISDVFGRFLVSEAVERPKLVRTDCVGSCCCAAVDQIDECTSMKLQGWTAPLGYL